MFWRRRSAEDFAEEIKAHLELEAEDLKREGLSEDEARWKARREFGNVRHAQEQFYLKGRLVWLDNLVRDLRFALRQMRRSPGFALTAILTLALGIAANVIVFGVLQALVLRPLDVPDGDRVMTLARTDQTYPIFSYPEVRDVREGNTVFSAVAAWGLSNYGLEASGVTRPVLGYEVGGQYFEVVGIKPFLGRLLERSDDDHPGASEVAVLSWSTWKADFNGDPDVVGETIRINKHPYTIVGVTPEGFFGTEKFVQPDLFVPLVNRASLGGADTLESRAAQNVWSIVRMKGGVTMPQAQAELKTIAARIARQYPKEEEKLSFKLTRSGLMGDFFGAPARGFLVGVLGLACIVLLAACANLGSLFAARTADRAREIAIRMATVSKRLRELSIRVALGAQAKQILSAAFGRTLILLAAGSVVGMLLGVAASRLLSAIVYQATAQDPFVLAAVAMTLLLTGLLSVAGPVRRVLHVDPANVLREG
jgi:MacB-like periplasmic core domain